MSLPIAAVTLRECLRTPLPYLCAGSATLVGLASRAMLGFTFGRGVQEIQALAVACVLLAGVAGAVLQGTTLVRRDIERGTLALFLSMPNDLINYIAGRYIGLVASTTVIGVVTAAALTAILWLLPPEGAGSALSGSLFLACGRALVLVAVLDAAALAASSLASRVVAPILLFGYILLGGLVARGPFSLPMLDPSLFALEPDAAFPVGWGLLYAALFCCAFLLAAYIVLTLHRPIRGQG